MKFEIHSFESIEKRADLPWEVSTALISIGDVGVPQPVLKYKPDYLLRLEFDDIMPDEFDDCRVDLKHLFNDKQAQQIAEFVYDVMKKVDLLIFQCEHGHSRSAGCAAAVAEHFSRKGIKFFADYRYYPNKLVFHKVIKALNKIKEKM